MATALFLSIAATVQGASVYDTVEDISDFGWLDQYSLDNSKYNFVGDEACVPTSSTNAMTYLQNLAPAAFGSVLTGTTYTDWIAADDTLISAPYMNTQVKTGTDFFEIPDALTKYVTTDRGINLQLSGMFEPGSWDPPAHPRPDYISDAVPTGDFIYQSLSEKSALLLSIYYSDNSGGHEILAGGLDWTDSNGDGIMEFDENATLSFIDPLDPTATYPVSDSSSAAFTTGHIWYDAAAGDLRVTYNQYEGTLPYSPSDYEAVTADVIDAFAMGVPVPEPGSGVLVIVGLGILMVVRRCSFSPVSGPAR